MTRSELVELLIEKVSAGEDVTMLNEQGGTYHISQVGRVDGVAAIYQGPSTEEPKQQA